MKDLFTKVRTFILDEEGASAVEYGLLVGRYCGGGDGGYIRHRYRPEHQIQPSPDPARRRQLISKSLQPV